MSLIAFDLPRVSNPDTIFEDPLGFLADARSAHGDQVVLRDGASLLSHSLDCPGVLALFGADSHRRVLTAPEDFTAAPSIAPLFDLPDSIARLNRSLHVMEGPDHALHKRAIATALTPALLDAHRDAIEQAIARFCASWRAAGSIPLFAGLQRLMAEIGVLLLFGAKHRPGSPLHAALALFFALRRGLSRDQPRDSVIAVGYALDELLGAAIAVDAMDVPQQLARDLPDVTVRAHLNVLFMSLVEPVAVAATWTLLLLTQRPQLRQRLRAARDPAGPLAPSTEMNHAVLETLRLLSPNALMVRVAAKQVECAGASIPQGCEIVLAPFLTHRDPAIFADPTVFRPSRWAALGTVPPFGFLPFGVGPHACVGRRLAEALVAQVVDGVLARLDPVLPRQQAIDWRVDITFRPRADFDIFAGDLIASPNQEFVTWSGPVADLVHFEHDAT
jgi:cytochrome P450